MPHNPLLISLIALSTVFSLNAKAQFLTDAAIEEQYEALEEQPSEVIRWADSVLQIPQLTALDRAYVHMISSDASYYDEDMRSSTTSMKAALAAMPDDFPPAKKVEAHNSLGQNYSNLGWEDSSIVQYKMGLRLALEIRDSIEISNLYYNLALGYMSYSDYDLTLAYFDSTYQVLYYLQDSIGLSHALRASGHMNDVFFDHETARKMYQKALPYVTDADQVQECVIYTSIATSYWASEKIDSAAWYTDLAEQCFLSEHDQTSIQYLHSIQARVALAQGDTLAAQAFIQQAIERSTTTGDIKEFYSAKTFQMQIDSSKRSLEIIEGMLNSEVAPLIKEKLYDIYTLYSSELERAGRIEEALKALQKAREIQTQMVSDNNQKLIQSQAARFDVLLKEKEVKLAKEELKITQANWITYVTAGTALVLLVFGMFWYRSKRSKFKIEQERLEQEKQLLQEIAAMESRAFRAQINPHFIFNALNSIKGLIANQQTKEASLYVSKFSKLVRNVLDNSRETTITLQKEMETLELYARLEQMRFRDGFEFAIELDDGIDASDVMLPPSLLQPFVENSVWHGFKNNPRKNQLALRASAKNNILLLELEDNGVGRAKAGEALDSHKRKSHGIAITQERINNHKVNGRVGKLSYTDLTDSAGEPCGTIVHLELPLNED